MALPHFRRSVTACRAFKLLHLPPLLLQNSSPRLPPGTSPLLAPLSRTYCAMAASSLDDTSPVQVDASDTAEKLDLDEKLTRLENQWEEMVRQGSTTAMEQNESTSSGNWEVEKAAAQEVLDMDQLISRLERQRELAAQLKSTRAQKRQGLIKFKSVKIENIVAEKCVMDAKFEIEDLESQRAPHAAVDEGVCMRERQREGVGSAEALEEAVPGKVEMNLSAMTEEIVLHEDINKLERPKEVFTELNINKAPEQEDSSSSGRMPVKTAAQKQKESTSSGNMEKKKAAIGEELDLHPQISKMERQEEVLSESRISRTPELKELASSGNSEVATAGEIDLDQIVDRPQAEKEVAAKLGSTRATSSENVKMKVTSLAGEHRAKVASSEPKSAAPWSKPNRKDQASGNSVQEERPIGLLKRESLTKESGQPVSIDNEEILSCNSALESEAKEEELKSGVSSRALQMNHPWVEWNAFLDVLHQKNYFKDVPLSAFEGEGQSRFELSAYMRRAISEFSCDHEKFIRTCRSDLILVDALLKT